MAKRHVRLTAGRPRADRARRASYGASPSGRVPIWAWFLVAGGAALMFAGQTAVVGLVTNYIDRRSFAQMMNGILADLGISNPEARLIMIGQAGVETDFGLTGVAPTVNNFWNITAGSSWTGRTIDGPDRDAQGNPIIQHWRAYPGPVEGAQDYIYFLSILYPDALLYAQTGDAESFAYALHARGYYTAAAGTYSSNLAARVDQARGYLS